MLFGYEFKNKGRQQQALDPSGRNHKLWAQVGHQLLKIIADDLVRQGEISEHFGFILRSDEFVGSIVISTKIFKLVNFVKCDDFQDINEDINRLEIFFERLQPSFEAFHVPCYRRRDNCIEVLHVPTILSDVFKALIYAIYLDLGKNVDAFLHISRPFRDVIVELFSHIENLIDPTSISRVDVDVIKMPSTARRASYGALDWTGRVIGEGYSETDARKAAGVWYLYDANDDWTWAVHFSDYDDNTKVSRLFVANTLTPDFKNFPLSIANCKALGEKSASSIARSRYRSSRSLSLSNSSASLLSRSSPYLTVTESELILPPVANNVLEIWDAQRKKLCSSIWPCYSVLLFFSSFLMIGLAVLLPR